jgi:ribosome-associated protein
MMQTMQTEEAPIKTTDLVAHIREALSAKLAIDPIVLDVHGVSDVTDYYIIATGNSPPHLNALCEEVEFPLKRAGMAVYQRSGTPESGWMVIDYVDVVVHIFSPEARDYYALEKLWGDAEVVA